MPVKLQRPQERRSVFETIKEDKVKRWSHPVGASIFTALKAGFSAIPLGTLVADDATLMRLAQLVDRDFQLTYDKEGALNRTAYEREVVRRLNSENEGERTTASLLLSHLRRHLQQQARARKAVPLSRTKYSASAMSQNRKLLQHLEKQHGALKFLAKDSTRLANPAAINPFARRFGEYKANFAAVRKKMRN